MRTTRTTGCRPLCLLLLALAVSLHCQKDPRPAPPGRDRAPASAATSAAVDPDDLRGSSLTPPPREPGPALEEPSDEVSRVTEQAALLARTMTRSGVAPREVASIADMHGYRLYRKRRFKSARGWFEQAARSDPSFEMSLFNAARCAALVGDRAAARRHLEALRRLDTPLARLRIRMAGEDPDFKDLME